MISDKKLKIISLIISLVGIITIYAVSIFAGHAFVQIGTISTDDAGRHVVINGTITDYRTSNGNMFFKIDDGTGKIQVVMFERIARNQNVALKENDMVLVEGQINIYKDELEIVANSINLIENS